MTYSLYYTPLLALALNISRDGFFEFIKESVDESLRKLLEYIGTRKKYIPNLILIIFNRLKKFNKKERNLLRPCTFLRMWNQRNEKTIKLKNM